MLLGGECVAAHRFQLWLAFKAMARGHMALADRVVHDGVERAHLARDSGIADRCAVAAFAVFAPPSQVLRPAVLPDQMDLGAADVIVECAPNPVFEALRPVDRYHSIVSAALDGGDVFFGHVAKGPVEDPNVMLQFEANLGIEVERLIARRLTIRCSQGDRFVAIFLGQPDPAIEVPVRHLAATANDQAGFQLLLVRDKCHAPRSAV